MRLNSKFFRAFPVILALSLIITLLACQTDSPTRVEQTVVESYNQVKILKVKDKPASLHKFFSQEQVMDDDGGMIRLGDYESGYSGLKFPEDAINEDVYPDGVLIEFIWQSESLLQADFYPEGLTFDEPVTIRLSYKDADIYGIDQNALGIYYYNPMTDYWELVSSSYVNTQGKYVQAYINHFSRYAVGME